MLITPSGPIVAHNPAPYTPVLARPSTSRPGATRHHHGRTVAADRARRASGKAKQAKRKPKRHLFRSFMTLVLLFGLLGGGAFAAKKYLLHEPTWSVELKPLADDVAATRGLQFSEAVTVTPVPVADYAARLAGSAIDTRDRTCPWRALGLLNGDLDLGPSAGRRRAIRLRSTTRRPRPSSSATTFNHRRISTSSRCTGR